MSEPSSQARASGGESSTPQLMSYLAERNIGVFSTDIDSRDFKLHKPEDVIKSVMSQLEKHCKSMILMHDFKHHTAEAMPVKFFIGRAGSI